MTLSGGLAAGPSLPADDELPGWDSKHPASLGSQEGSIFLVHAAHLRSSLPSIHRKGSTSANKTYDSGVQSALVLSLAVGAPPSEDVAMRTHHALTQSVADERYHYTTGILGFKHLFDELDKFPVDTCVKEVGRKTAAAVLSEGSTNTEGNWRNGQVRQPWDGAMLQTAHGLHLAARPKLPRLSLGSDLSLAILMQLDYPSIGYGFANPYEPANESLWELADAPFEGPGMNSRNHHMWSCALLDPKPARTRSACSSLSRARRSTRPLPYANPSPPRSLHSPSLLGILGALCGGDKPDHNT
eukprot:scaffold249529_cov35-Tisochrysis_lutea.AAC.2